MNQNDSTRPIDLSTDDTEGHALRHGIETDATDDTEGHAFRHGIETDATDDDTEGHMHRQPRPTHPKS